MNNFLKMGPLTNIASMIPGMSGVMEQVGEEETSKKIKNMIYIMDSMTTSELDSNGRIFTEEPERIIRVARGSGCSAVEVEMVLQQQRMMSSMAQGMGGAGGMPGMPGMGGAPGVGGGAPGGAAGMQRMMQQAQLNPNFMQQAMKMFGGAGGMGGGMPDMSSMMQNPQMIQQAQQMMRANPNMMQQAQQMMQNPGMMQQMMSQFGGGMGM